MEVEELGFIPQVLIEHLLCVAKCCCRCWGLLGPTVWGSVDDKV